MISCDQWSCGHGENNALVRYIPGNSKLTEVKTNEKDINDSVRYIPGNSRLTEVKTYEKDINDSAIPTDIMFLPQNSLQLFRYNVNPLSKFQHWL